LKHIRPFLRTVEEDMRLESSILDDLGARIGMSRDAVKEAARKYEYRYQIFNNLGKDTATWFSDELAAAFDDGRLFVGEVPLLSFNATVSCDDESYQGTLILLNRGFVNLINDIVKVMVSSFNVATTDFSKKRETPLKYTEGINTMLKLLATIKEGFRYVGPFDRFLSPSDLHYDLQGEFIFAIERYAIAHELAHISKGHIQQPDKFRVSIADSPVHVGINEHSHSQELEADSFAAFLSVMDVALKFYKSIDNPIKRGLSKEEMFKLRGRVWGILGLHSILRLLEKAAFGSDTLASHSHPCGRDREKNVRDILSGLSQRPFAFDISAAFDPFDKFLKDVYAKLS